MNISTLLLKQKLPNTLFFLLRSLLIVNKKIPQTLTKSYHRKGPAKR